jgi:uncharacterized protein YndB with AHSA1/START domain
MTWEMKTCIDLDAAPERVWDVLTDVPAYPAWYPGLTSAEGAFAVGGRVVFRYQPMHPLLRSTVPLGVLEVTPGRRLRYVQRFARLGTPGVLDAELSSTIDVRDGRVRLWLQFWVRGVFLRLIIRSLSPDETPTFGPLPTALRARIEGTAAPAATELDGS